jgi:NitT/TauT family transport system substrate-binding protein
MTATRYIMALFAATMLVAAPALSYAESVRIGLPTKTYWPTTVAEAAAHQKFFEKEGVTAEITIYRGGAECFEALAAGAADLILDAPALPAAWARR